MSNTPVKKSRFRVLRWLLMSVLVLVASVGVFAYLTVDTFTAPFVDEAGKPVENSIAEERRMLIGGVEQYVLLRGRDRNAPLLVFVHGGPGASETPFLRRYNADLENDFVVVYWDQRGAVHSYSPDLDPATFTIERMTEDLRELVDTLLVEFDQEKVLLVGHSWGTIPALEYTAQHPDKVATYISISQTTNQQESDAEGFEWALSQAKKAGDEEAIATLEALGRPPYTLQQFITQRQHVGRYGGSFKDGSSDLKLASQMIMTDEFSWLDLGAFVKGVRLSGNALWEEQKHYDAESRYTTLDAPIVMMFGRGDRVISPRLGLAYFEVLEAPSKEFIWFENSAHAPLFEEPEKFNDAVRQVARGVGLLK